MQVYFLVCNLFFVTIQQNVEAAVYCSDPPNIDNADCFKGGQIVRSGLRTVYREGSAVQYQCRSGFTIQGNAVVTCRNGRWNPLPSCLEDQCKDLPTIQNGVCSLSSTNNGPASTLSTARPTAATTGDYITDYVTVIWDTTEADEIGGITDFETTDFLDSYTTMGLYDYYTTVGFDEGSDLQTTEYAYYYDDDYEYESNRGFRRNSTDLAATTKRFGALNGNRGHSSKTKILRRNRSTTPGLLSTIASYRKSGLNQQTATTRRLGGRATNMRKRRAIRRPTSTPGLVMNANRIATRTRPRGRSVDRSGSLRQVSCRCNSGFKMSGSATVNCNSNGNWSSLPMCQREATCSSLPDVPNARCRPSTNGIRSVSLQRNWYDMDKPIGNEIFGRILRIGADLTRTNTMRTEAGGVYECECKDGFSLSSDTDKLVCMNHGEWSPRVPSCEPAGPLSGAVYCSSPREVEHSQCYTVVNGHLERAIRLANFRRAMKVFENGDQLSFACDHGYKTIGTAVVTCQVDGTWTAFPTCQPIGCSGPPTITGGVCQKAAGGDQSFFQVNEQAECACDPGLRMNGLPVVECLEDQRWSTKPTCTSSTRSTCPQPPEVAGAGCNSCDNVHGQITFYSGDSIRYSCNVGYQMSGNPIITCQNNGRWSTTPSCNAIRTSAPICPLPKRV